MGLAGDTGRSRIWARRGRRQGHSHPGSLHPRGFIHFHQISRVAALTVGYVRTVSSTGWGHVGVGGDATVYRLSDDLLLPYGSPQSFHVVHALATRRRRGARTCPLRAVDSDPRQPPAGDFALTRLVTRHDTQMNVAVSAAGHGVPEGETLRATHRVLPTGLVSRLRVVLHVHSANCHAPVCRSSPCRNFSAPPSAIPAVRYAAVSVKSPSPPRIIRRASRS